MSWEDRLRPSLRLISPDGDKYTAQWAGDSRNLEKKLGIFEFPGLVGAVVQDLRVGASRHSIPFFFEGFNHDLEAQRLFRSAKQKGLWTLVHPVYGQVEWQLMTIKEDAQPVSSANVTKISTEWIEPIGVSVDISVQQVSRSVRNRSTEVQNKVNSQAGGIAKVVKPSDITRFKTAIRSAANTVKTALAPLTKTAADINAQVESVDRAITDALSSAVFSVTSLAGQVQTMIMLPSQIAGDMLTRIGYYQGLIESAITLTDAEQNDTTVNDAVVREVISVTSLAAISEIVAGSSPETRQEALVALTNIAAAFNSTLTGLDGSQDLLTGGYVSQSESFNDTSLMLAITFELLLRRSFDLATAKIISLNRHRTPTEIALTEDVDLDRFISTNGLKGDDILLLPPGRDVVVYA